MTVLMTSVDPGEVHTGLAYWIGAECIGIEEMGPTAFLDALWTWTMPEVNAIDVLVIEDFRLYPDKMGEQGYSQLATVKVIGAAQWIMHHRGRSKDCILQGASIKKATRAQLQARGVGLRAVNEKKGGHCADAELHGYYHLRQGGREKWLAQRKGEKDG